MHQVVSLFTALMLLGEQQGGPVGRASTAAIHAVKQRRYYACEVVAGVPAFLVCCCQRLQVMHLHQAVDLAVVSSRWWVLLVALDSLTM